MEIIEYSLKLNSTNLSPLRSGNISLRGNSNVRILINGKPSGLVGLSGPEGLRSIPSESIQQVEVVTSPSARYEAEGTAGILNIILKKQDLLGFNGNINLNLGIPEQFGTNGSFNLRNNKVNFFNTTSIRKRPYIECQNFI